MTSTCSTWRWPRLAKSSLSAAYSTLFQPVPMPRRSRLPDRTATSAACLATSTAWRCGRISTVEANSRSSVTAAAKAKNVSGSWKATSLS